MLRVVRSAWGADFVSAMGSQEDKCKFIHSETPVGRGEMVFWRTLTHLKVATKEDGE